MEQWKTACVVAGGGPAGMMLGYLLARSGVETILLEKHGDFFSSISAIFRRHASTLCSRLNGTS